MPTYEFRCPNGHTFDQFHRISDAPTAAQCPSCGVEAERVISGGAGLVFKGSGFYLTDYGKNAHRTSGPAKNGESATTGGAGEKTSGEKSSGDKSSSGEKVSGSSSGSNDSGGSSSGAGGSSAGSGSGSGRGSGSGAPSGGSSSKSGE